MAGLVCRRIATKQSDDKEERESGGDLKKRSKLTFLVPL